MNSYEFVKFHTNSYDFIRKFTNSYEFVRNFSILFEFDKYSIFEQNSVMNIFYEFVRNRTISYDFVRFRIRIHTKIYEFVRNHTNSYEFMRINGHVRDCIYKYKLRLGYSTSRTSHSNLLANFSCYLYRFSQVLDYTHLAICLINEAKIEDNV